MAKFGKKLFKAAVIGAAFAGVYYYLQKKDQEIPVNMDDADSEGHTEEPKKRSYVSLDFDTVSSKAKDVAGKVAEKAEKAASSIGSFISEAGERVEEFFDDRKNANAEANVDADDDDFDAASFDEEDDGSNE